MGPYRLILCDHDGIVSIHLTLLAIAVVFVGSTWGRND